MSYFVVIFLLIRIRILYQEINKCRNMINKPYAVNVKNPLLNIIDRCQTEKKA